MWSIRYLSDPLNEDLASDNNNRGRGSSSSPIHCTLAHATVALKDLLLDKAHRAALDEDKHTARVALSDHVARHVNSMQGELDQGQGGLTATVQLLDRALVQNGRKRKSVLPPYILERTDIWCNETELNIIVRAVVFGKKGGEQVNESVVNDLVKNASNKYFSRVYESLSAESMLKHVACAVLQQRARSLLKNLNAVAFVANGAILPRKSGASSMPMSSPPAVPFAAPQDSSMSQDVVVEMGKLRLYVALGNHVQEGESTKVTLSGLCIPTGITLICGGGYHGKSTLLRTISAGVYNKIPGDGREYCVTVNDAVSVRAEDGRPVNNCNISAFISNLPTPPGVTTSLDTTHFSTKEASGSTSQATNVSEAVEMGATALLVDEDVSAANFMARDGRMRALVMDESITPLLYRVNGLYQYHNVSFIVVVGGVGDWLDVQDHVVLMDKYIASDATDKARSISYQFSYGHVQYAGRGVVHRLPWDKSGTPLPRRPADAFGKLFDKNVSMSILDGGGTLSFVGNDDEKEDTMVIENGSNHDEDEHMGLIDMSRCEQLMGKKAQLYGCGLCVAWLLKTAQQEPNLGIRDLLAKMDETLNQNNGMLQLFASDKSLDTAFESFAWRNMVETLVCVVRPRKHEVAMALTRMRGIVMEEIPEQDDGAEEEAAREEERRKRELAEMWNSRRKGRLAYG